MAISKIGSDALAAGAPSKSQLPSGSILQVIHTDYNTPFTLLSSTRDMVTTVVTHSVANSKILLIGAGTFSTYNPNDGDQAQTTFYFYRDGTAIGDTGQWTAGSWYTSDVTSSYGTSYDTRQVNRVFLDSPAKAAGATTTYVLRASSGGATSYFNRGSNNSNTGTSASYLTILEVAP